MVRGRPHRREILGFAAAGLAAYAVDLALFTALRGPAGLGPLTAKGLSFLAGCTVAYAGNALGTYRHTRPRGPRPYAAFLLVNTAGAAVQLLCLAVSHYGLGFTSQRADTVSGAGSPPAWRRPCRPRRARARAPGLPWRPGPRVRP
ncbi:GtrA family protein, partial [Streptomyces nigra]